MTQNDTIVRVSSAKALFLANAFEYLRKSPVEACHFLNIKVEDAEKIFSMTDEKLQELIINSSLSIEINGVC